MSADDSGASAPRPGRHPGGQAAPAAGETPLHMFDLPGRGFPAIGEWLSLAEKLIVERMEGVVTLDVPLVVDVAAGQDLASVKT